MASRTGLILKLLLGLVLLIGLAALITWVVLRYDGRADTRQPTIVIILADDLGWDDVSFHGNDQIPTPNLDAFASHGVILNSLYSAPSCTASRSSLLTGKLPLHTGLQEYTVINGVYGSGLPLTHRLIPEHFRKLGYETHLIGKWDLGFYKESLLPTNRGFDTHYGHYSGAGTYYSHTYTEMEFLSLGSPTGYDFNLDGKSDFSAYGQYVTDLYDQRFRELVSRKSDKPRFIILSHMAVHGSYPGEELPAPESAFNGSQFAHVRHDHRKKYAGLVNTVDISFGKAIEALAVNGLLEKSIILFSSDNGGPSITAERYGTGASNSPFRGAKYSPWQGGVRVAAFIWSPLLKDAPYVNDKLYHLVDVLPTLYAAAGGNVTDLGKIDGMNVWESISNKSASSPRDRILLAYDRVNTVDYAGYAAIIGRYKLVSGKSQIFNADNYYLAAGNGLGDVEELERRRQEAPAHRILKQSGFARNISSSWREGATVKCSWSELICNNGSCEGLMVSPTGGDYLEVEVKPSNETLVCHFEHEPCLFDLEIDPCETVNLAKVYPNELQKLLNYVNAFEAEEPASAFEYTHCYDKNSNPLREDPPVWKPWAKGCDGLLGEPCPHKLVRDDSDFCPPGGDIQR